MKISPGILFVFALIGLSKAQLLDDDVEYGPVNADSNERVEMSNSDGVLGGGAKGCLPKCEWGKHIETLRQSFWSPETSARDSSSCACGIINKRTKEIIINGWTVNPQYRYPWAVALQQHGETFCGGALISDQHILTAAHCLSKHVGGAAFLASGGRGTFFQPNEVQIAFLTRTAAVVPGPPIKEIIPYPEFDSVNINNDIAVVKLSRKITCSKFRRPVCLPRPGMSADFDKVFTTVGWGTKGGEEGSEYLMEARIKRVAFRHCKKKFDKSMRDNFYCLRGVRNSSPCHGDSGGPMFANYRSRYYLFGVTSMHTSETCNTNDTFVYTQVPNYMNWIKRVTQKSTRLFNQPLYEKGSCYKNEEYGTCITACQPTCGCKNPICTVECVTGCRCIKGFIREKQGGNCIPEQKCPKGKGTNEKCSKETICRRDYPPRNV